MLLPQDHLRADDTLARPKHLTIRGVILQDVAPTGKISVPFTIANILKVAGLQGTDATTQAYFYDQTTAEYVIAPKTTVSGSSGPVTLTLFHIHPFPVGFFSTRQLGYFAGPAKALNGDLDGTVSSTQNQHGKGGPLISKITAYGLEQNVGTILEVTIVDSQ